MGEYGDDMEMAIHGFKDEVEGVKEYSQALATCKNHDLRTIFERALASEKEHATMLLDWINKNAQAVLR